MRDQKQRKVEFGDFQTPISLAREICSLIVRIGFHPASILEPTCGTGSFLKASLETFPNVSRVLGFEINPRYVSQAQQAIAQTSHHASIDVYQSDFFFTICYRTENPFVSCRVAHRFAGKRKLTGTRLPSRWA